MRSVLIIAACSLALAAGAAAQPGGEKKHCCVTDNGTAAWLDGMFTREECVAKRGLWSGDEPNVAKTVCAPKASKPAAEASRAPAPAATPMAPPADDDHGAKKPGG